MRKTVLPFLLLLAACQPAAKEERTSENEEPNALDKYSGLVGQWVDSTSSDQYICYERWAKEGDSALVGIGHVVAGADTVFLEELRVAQVDGQVTYAVRSGSQNNGTWVHFVAEPTGKDTLMFENATHDFPQCVTYSLQDNDWHVTVSGTERGKERLLSYHFRPR